MRLSKSHFISALVISALSFFSPDTYAHVKWFSDFASAPEPILWNNLMSGQLVILFTASVMAVFLLCAIHAWYLYGRPIAMSRFLLEPSFRQTWNEALHVALLLTVLLCWHHNVVLTPELVNQWEAVGFLQFLILAIGFIPRLRAAVPVGILVLYLLGVYQAGFFHMLDYLFVLGVAWFVWITPRSADEKQFREAVTVVYATTGFSLCWVGIEKLIHPHWAVAILQEYPMLAMGFSHDFFVQSAALVEFTIGFFFLIQQWPLICALVLSGIMVLTTMLFGVKEIVGHLLLHVILLMFIFVGSVRPMGVTMREQPALEASVWSGVYALSLVVLTAIYYGLSVIR